MKQRPGLKVTALASLLLALSACTSGVDAGKKGGEAFIWFTVMLLATLFILWLVLGRDD